METKKLDMYDSVGYEADDIRDIVDGLVFCLAPQSNADNIADDGESHLIETMMSCCQRFGATDYKDHRSDSLQALIEKVLPNIKRGAQRLHFYGTGSIPVKKCLVKGYLGGYTGWFVYDGSENGVGRKTN